MKPTKEELLEALTKFARQRPGLEFGNYGNVKAYRAELRSITRSLADYNVLVAAVYSKTSITAEDLLKATSAYSGRLQFKQDGFKHDGSVHVDYTTGQYWPTEYRNAACAVLAAALWDVERTEPWAKVSNIVGDSLRLYFRREFGRGVQSRWFN